MKCPYCESNVNKVDSKMIYGKSYGMIYICSTYPECSAYVGAHRDTGEPLGTLADSELREYRKMVHEKFDRLWKQKKISRTDAYKWLSKNMRITKDKAHIGMFDVEKCKEVLRLLNRDFGN